MTGRARWGGMRANLVGAIVTATAAQVLTVLLLEDPVVQYREEIRARRDLNLVASRVNEELPNHEPDEVADRLGAKFGCHVQIFDRNQHLIGDTAQNAPRMKGTLSDFVDIKKALKRGHAWNPIGDAQQIQTLVSNNHRYVLISLPLELIHSKRSSVRELLLTGGVVAILIALFLTVALSRSLVRPVRELTMAANALAQGDLSVRVRSSRMDEIGELGKSLDDMADQLEERIHNLRAEEARLRTVVDSMEEAVFVTDSAGKIVMTNQALITLIHPDPLGSDANRILESAELKQAIKAARKGSRETLEVRLPHGNDFKHFKAYVSPLPERAGVVTVLHDMTDIKATEKIRRDFVANASHELRTPLTAIRGFAETLRDGAIADKDTTQRFLGMILKHTLRLERLVHDLLVLSRIESTEEPLKLEPVHIAAVAASVVEGLEAKAAQRKLSVILEPIPSELSALANEEALDQILMNLVDNAIKYTPEGGKVLVRAEADDQSVTIKVEDSGPGVPARDLERVFERFYRVDKGRSRDMGGTGLGLAIVKHLAAKMRANVHVESEVGKGSTFVVSLKRIEVDRKRQDVLR